MKIPRSVPARWVAVVAFAVVALASTLGSAQGDPPPTATSSLQTASYPLFAVEDSGVTGQLQVVELAEGGTQLILTVHGIVASRPYTSAVYVGSCGPDRPVFLELEPIGRANDPFVSITESTRTFAEVTQGDHFVYVFDGDAIDRPDVAGLDVPALACGEVGLGALEGQP